MAEESSNNGTSVFDDLLRICWRLQDCGSCLRENNAPCSWCPVVSSRVSCLHRGRLRCRMLRTCIMVCCVPNLTPLQSSTCIPNTAQIPLLAPIRYPDVCPHWAERWEIRTRPLGCHVSTITFLSCVVSILSTFLVVGLVVLAVWLGKNLRGRWKGRQRGWWKVWRLYRAGWWRGWRIRLVNVRRNNEEGEGDERRRLLGEGMD